MQRSPYTPSAPSSWHPRSNAYGDRWVCRNGRWGTIYGEILAEDVHRNMLWGTVYHATFLTEGTRRPLGEFPTGDAASEALWAVFNDWVEETGRAGRKL